MTKIALNFEDGVTKIIESNPEETLSESSSRAGINIPLDCKDGVCGICKCKIKSGSCDLGFYIDDALTEKEASDGFALACQMVPQTDMVIDILASSEACKVEVETFETTITAIEFLSSEIVKLTVKTQNGDKFHFLEGQYANIEIPISKLTRAYSFSSGSNSETGEFIVRLLPQGAMSDYIRQVAKVGDALKITGPFGGFYLRDITKPTLFFAGGTGIAPFLAMLDKLSKHRIHHPVHIFYGATTDENLVELDKLKCFEAHHASFKFFTCVSIEKSTQHVQGFVTQWIKKEELRENCYDMYICGPPAMVEAVKNSIETEKIPQDHFYEEKFVPTGTK